MRLVIFILLICSFSFSQKTYEFTEEEVTNLFNSITELEYADSVNAAIIVNLKQQINTYEQQITDTDVIIAEQQKQLELKDELIKQIKPRWYEHKYLWYGYGVASVIIPIHLAGQLK